jgi:hypothetical protein
MGRNRIIIDYGEESDELGDEGGLNSLILMQIHSKPTIKDSWSTDPYLHTAIFSAIMTSNRFEYIEMNLRTYREEDVVTFLENSNTDDKFIKIRKIFDMFNENFTNQYNMEQEISIDESMVKWKGHHQCKRYK